MTKCAVLVFPGSNCDNDAYFVLKNIFKIEVDFVWHKDSNLDSYHMILIPGGFSYGDYLRTGAIAKFSPIMKEVVSKSKKGIPVIGICNGFQILLECGLLPGALINNKNIKFLSQNVKLEVQDNLSIFTNKLNKGDTLEMPIAHKQGNYIADIDTIKMLKDNNRIAFKYSNNPNGSQLDIAGITNKRGNVLGMMPHPERACDKILGSDDGKLIFQSIIDSRF
ncbi:phosphoribosylformylglycinamidine synthase subunit PurQ [Candidatus Marinimicrobia bacterium]|nr:phosphoribosylformylglycinamidine synthase subunit PurQ [Candidatus Neomarinimicrobiota bacterium]